MEPEMSMQKISRASAAHSGFLSASSEKRPSRKPLGGLFDVLGGLVTSEDWQK